MRKWVTEIIAIEAATGKLKTWIGEHIEAPTWELAQSWCDEHKGYLKVTGELIAEIPCNDETYEADWENEIDYKKAENN